MTFVASALPQAARAARTDDLDRKVQRVQTRVLLAHYEYDPNGKNAAAYEVWIYRNGDVEFRGMHSVKTRGDATGTIAPELVEAIDALVGEAGFTKLGIVRRDPETPLYGSPRNMLTYWDPNGVGYEDDGRIRDDRMTKADYDAVQEEIKAEHQRVEILKAALDTMASIDRWAGTLEERALLARERLHLEAEMARADDAFVARVDKCEADPAIPVAISLPKPTRNYYSKLSLRREACVDSLVLGAAGEQALLPEPSVETYDLSSVLRERSGRAG